MTRQILLILLVAFVSADKNEGGHHSHSAPAPSYGDHGHQDPYQQHHQPDPYSYDASSYEAYGGYDDHDDGYLSQMNGYLNSMVYGDDKCDIEKLKAPLWTLTGLVGLLLLQQVAPDFLPFFFRPILDPITNLPFRSLEVVTSRAAADYVTSITDFVTNSISDECVDRLACECGAALVTKSREGKAMISMLDFVIPNKLSKPFSAFKASALRDTKCSSSYKCNLID